MDTNYLMHVAEFQTKRWWRLVLDKFPSAGTVPEVKLNNRLKTTAGRALLDEGFIELSTELFWQYTENFCKDTIAHELAHIAAYRVFNDPGHGRGWKLVMQGLNVPANRLHHMVNHQHAARKKK